MSQICTFNLGGPGSKWGFTRLALESWKSARGKNVSQISALNLGGSSEKS